MISGATDLLSPATVVAAMESVRTTPDGLILNGFGLLPGLDDATHEFAFWVERQAAAGSLVFLDVNLVESDEEERRAWRQRLEPLLPHTDYFCPNFEEARMVLGLPHSGMPSVDEALDLAHRLASEFQVRQAVAVKCGVNGVALADGGDQRTFVEGQPVHRVEDSTGAGDAWLAGFSHSLLCAPKRDWSRILKAARFGCDCGAKCVAVRGSCGWVQ